MHSDTNKEQDLFTVGPSSLFLHSEETYDVIKRFSTTVSNQGRYIIYIILYTYTCVYIRIYIYIYNIKCVLYVRVCVCMCVCVMMCMIGFAKTVFIITLCILKNNNVKYFRDGHSRPTPWQVPR